MIIYIIIFSLLGIIFGIFFEFFKQIIFLIFNLIFGLLNEILTKLSDFFKKSNKSNKKVSGIFLNGELKKENIEVTKNFNFGLLKEKFIIDDKNKKIIIVSFKNFRREYKKIEYNKLMDFELIQDNVTLDKISLLRTAVFGLLGALFRVNSKKKKYCKSMKIKLNINDSTNSLIYINVISSKIKLNSKKYKKIKKKTEKILDGLKDIKNKNYKLEEKN
mgnify:CR=1 FL=1